MRGHAVTALLAATVVLASCDNPSNTGYAEGGSGGRSNADPAMQRMAQEAPPLIQGLDRCKQQYRTYPPNPEATMGCLPHGMPMRREGGAVIVADWRISPDPTGEGYTM